MAKTPSKDVAQRQMEALNEASVKSKHETAVKSGLGFGFGLDINKESYLEISDFMADNTVGEPHMTSVAIQLIPRFL